MLSSRAQRSLVPRCDTVDGVVLKVKGTLLNEKQDGMYDMQVMNMEGGMQPATSFHQYLQQPSKYLRSCPLYVPISTPRRGRIRRGNV